MTKTQDMTHVHARQAVASMLDTLTKIDATLTGNHLVKVRNVVPSGGVPSWTDGVEISITNVGDYLSSRETNGIEALLGVNYHELAHLLHTPFHGMVYQWVKDNPEFRAAWNILEDHRIESMLTAQYPDTAPYLMTMFARVFLPQVRGDDLGRLYPFIVGRDYLPREIRTAAAQQYSDQSKVADLRRITREFSALPFVARQSSVSAIDDRAIKLVKEFHALLSGDARSVDTHNHTASSPAQPQGTPQQNEQARQAMQDRREQQDRQEQAEQEAGDEDTDTGEQQRSGSGESDEPQEQQDSQGGDDDASSEDASDDTGEGDTQASGGGSGDEDSQDGSQEPQNGSGDDESDGEPQDTGDDTSDAQTGSGGSGAGGGSALPETITDALDMIHDMVASNPQVQREVGQIARKIRNAGDTLPSMDTFKVKKNTNVPVTPAMALISRRMGQAFRQIVEDMDPGHRKYQSSGRVNIGRAMRGDDPETVFDSWDQGIQDAGSVEMVIVFDISGSMSKYNDIPSQSLWLVQSAIESIGPAARVTTILFESNAYLLRQPGERADRTTYPYFNSQGGTNPASAIRQAHQILLGSKKRKKIFLIVTDGDFETSFSDNYTRMFQRIMDVPGTVSAGLSIGHATIPAAYPLHLRANITEPSQMVGIAHSLVRETLRVR